MHPEIRAVLFNFGGTWALGLFGLADRPVWLRSNQFAIIGEPISGLYWTPDRMARTADGKLALRADQAANAERIAALRAFVESLPIAEVDA